MSLSIKISIAFLFFFTSLVNYSQKPELLETIRTEDNALNIPYQKYRLPNGLTVIFHEDHSDPLVHVDVTYHVGSAREEPGRSGFAHFFEHMMFQGSQNAADEQHFKIVTESGGFLNGTTNRDRTNYYQTVPADQLERILWLEADRMGFLLEAVTQEKFEVQRATVKNEKVQNYDNKPYGLHHELMMETLYPIGHPYSWLTIGRLEDLNRADLSDLQNFFLRWYGPNNATLTVGGDIDPKKLLVLVEKYFGPIPKGPEVEPMKVAPVRLKEHRYISYYDKNIRFPALVYKFPTVPHYHADKPALDALSKLLGRGKTSYLYQEFVEKQKVVGASTSHACNELAGEFNIFIQSFPEESLAKLRAQVEASIADFDVNSISEEDIMTFKTQYEAFLFRRLEKVAGKVSQLATYETFIGNPNYLQIELQNYRAITKADVVRVYEQYIKDKPSVVMSILASEDAEPAMPDNFKREATDTTNIAETFNAKIPFRKVSDNFDRSVIPNMGESHLVSIPDYWKEKWDNGIELIGAKSTEIPVVSLRIKLYGGQLYDPKGKSGLGSLTAALLNEATQHYSTSEMAAELGKLGSTISISSKKEYTVVSLWSLTKNLEHTFALLQEKLFRPAFNERDFARLKKQVIERSKAIEQQPRDIASLVFNRLLYGEDHILTPPIKGFPEDLETISLEDVKSHYNKYYVPDHAEVIIVGDVAKDEIVKKLGFLKAWKSTGMEKVTIPELPTLKNTTIYIVDKPGAPQSEIRIGYSTGLRYDVTGDYYKAILLNYPLGGAFNSRINLNLRENKGYTYGARSAFSGDEHTGYFMASASVKADATTASVQEFVKELKMYQEYGITGEELAFTQAAVGRSEALNYETLGKKAVFLDRLVTYNLDGSYKKKQQQVLRDITEDELDTLAATYIRPDQMMILVVGDKAQNLEKLKGLGYDIVELDTRGNPMSKVSN